jgi:(p)ppGpp synthase/HD superfamily hydrolase
MDEMLTRVDRALVRAGHWHAQQRRRSTDVPYVAHLWGVASLVAEMGGTEDEIIAGLLHDAVEDQGGLPILRQIEEEFGSEVARVVLACSDTTESPKPPWQARKEAYLHRLRQADRSVVRVSLADKIHNARSLVMDLRESGLDALEKFSGKKDGTLWYYREVTAILLEQANNTWSHELARLTHEMHRLVEGDPSEP